ncbi:MAG: CotH kinase family protein [Alistipes sp.]|nr:CotH kinase family protein [Alistipes sp.]
MIKFNFRSLLALFVVVALMLVGCVVDEPLGDVDDTTGNGGGDNWTEKPVGGDEKPGDEGSEPGDDTDDPNDDNTGSNGGSTPLPDTSWAEGELDWVFDMSVLPEIHISVTEDQWNELLMEYDRDSQTNHYIHCDAEFESKGEKHTFADAGLRLRGNTSRRRPEGNGGEKHKRNNSDWHHCHFMLNLRKFQKDDAHELHNVRKIYLKWHKDDRAYCRELYCYDLFRRFGIWTAAYSSYCRLWIHVEGDSKPAYYGVYEMIEAIDDKFVKKRKDLFGDHKHNLWKCSYPANLNYNDVRNANIHFDDDSGATYTYELKSNIENFNAAKEQLIEFSRNLTKLQGDEFKNWIAKVCDVELLLRTYAVNVIVGMWDDYWNNSNNYYIYFNSSDKNDYKFFFIPFDYDNTLGTSTHCGAISDSGRHDPLNWGDTNNRPLIGKILQIDEYRKIYVDALNELCDPANDLFYYTHSIARIKGWHSMISPYVDNDTEEDCEIKDRPAGWSNYYDYRLLDANSSMNFFKVKASSIPKK